jgi:hypothetical protein
MAGVRCRRRPGSSRSGTGGGRAGRDGGSVGAVRDNRGDHQSTVGPSSKPAGGGDKLWLGKFHVFLYDAV